MITRRSLINASLLSTVIIAIPRSGLATQRSQSASTRWTTETFGLPHKGPGQFERLQPLSLGLSQGQFLDGIYINGTLYGTGAAPTTPERRLRGDDYWNTFEIDDGQWVNRVRFKSRDGIEIGTTGPTQTTITKREGIRIVSLSGAAGQRVDYLRIEYIENYIEAKVVEEDVSLLYQIMSSGQSIERYVETSTRNLDSLKRVAEHSSKINGSVDIKISEEIMAKSNIEIYFSEKTEEFSEIEEILRKSEKKTIVVDKDRVGLLRGRVNIMESANGQRWLLPTEAAEWLTLRSDEIGNLKGSYSIAANDDSLSGLSIRRNNGFRQFVAD